MIAGRRGVRESVRAFRANWKGCARLQMASNPFMVARRKAAYQKRRRLPGQMRAYQALNVMGVRIWANKPRLFKGYAWRARRATVARSIEIAAFMESRAWQRAGESAFMPGRGRHWYGVDLLCVTAGELSFTGALDAPVVLAAGSCCGFDDGAGGVSRGPSIHFRGGCK